MYKENPIYISLGAFLTFFAYGGVETIPKLSEETKNSKKYTTCNNVNIVRRLRYFIVCFNIFGCISE